MACTIHITGAFQRGFQMSDDNKKSIADGIRDLIQKLALTLESRIRFNRSDESVTFTIKEGDDAARKLVPEIERMDGVKATVAGSVWGLLVGRRSSMLEAAEATGSK